MKLSPRTDTLEQADADAARYHVVEIGTAANLIERLHNLLNERWDLGWECDRTLEVRSNLQVIFRRRAL